MMVSLVETPKTCDQQFDGDDAARRLDLNLHSRISHRLPRQPGAINLRGWTAGTVDGDMLWTC
jgi:hypothetical protein